MKLPYPMLLEFVQTTMTAEEAGDLLTMAGFELEGIETVEGDPVLDIKVMANRGDGLSALGLARELLAKHPEARPTDLYIEAMRRFPMADEQTRPATISDRPVIIETADCTRYACRYFVDVENGDSPEWLQKRLRQAGQRPISLIVDLTNYVMLELGQPLHAFDIDTLAEKRIVVRKAQAGEKLTTLNGIEHELNESQMMICDGKRPVAAAGIMGGSDTEVNGATKNLLLESAHFVSSSVRRTRKEMGLNTEASYRFERSVDPMGVVAALNRFAMLYAQCTGDDTALVKGVVDVFPTKPERHAISLRVARANLLLGMKVLGEQIKSYLDSLGFEVKGNGETFEVTPPSWRPDVMREEDVIEEIGRVHGYEKIPELLPEGTNPRGGVFGVPHLLDRAREAMVRCGFFQMMSHTLRDRHPLDFHEKWRIGPRNPHSPEMALMRDSLLPGLAEAMHRNGGKNLHLFEIGNVFLQGEYQCDESPELAIISTGRLYPSHWQKDLSPEVDFFSIKGVIEEVACSIGVEIIFDYPRVPDRRFHPMRQSGVLVDEGKLWVGTIGQIHPDLAEQLDLPIETYMAELDLLVFAVQHKEEPKLRRFSRNPAVRRDMAFIIGKGVPYSEIERVISEACGETLERQWLFDVYEGSGIPADSHSLAVALQLRKMGENMTDEEANEVRDRAVSALLPLGAVIRQ